MAYGAARSRAFHTRRRGRASPPPPGRPPGRPPERPGPLGATGPDRDSGTGGHPQAPIPAVVLPIRAPGCLAAPHPTAQRASAAWKCRCHGSPPCRESTGMAPVSRMTAFAVSQAVSMSPSSTAAKTRYRRRASPRSSSVSQAPGSSWAYCRPAAESASARSAGAARGRRTRSGRDRGPLPQRNRETPRGTARARTRYGYHRRREVPGTPAPTGFRWKSRTACERRLVPALPAR